MGAAEQEEAADPGSMAGGSVCVCVCVCVWSMFSIVAFLLLSGRISPSFSSPG